MANNRNARSIRVLRKKGDVKNAMLAPGQPFYNKTKNTLAVGKDGSSAAGDDVHYLDVEDNSFLGNSAKRCNPLSIDNVTTEDPGRTPSSTFVPESRMVNASRTLAVTIGENSDKKDIGAVEVITRNNKAAVVPTKVVSNSSIEDIEEVDLGYYNGEEGAEDRRFRNIKIKGKLSGKSISLSDKTSSALWSDMGTLSGAALSNCFLSGDTILGTYDVQGVTQARVLNDVFDPNSLAVKKALEVTSKINGKPLSDIFEADGITVKKAADADSAGEASYAEGARGKGTLESRLNTITDRLDKLGFRGATIKPNVPDGSSYIEHGYCYQQGNLIPLVAHLKCPFSMTEEVGSTSNVAFINWGDNPTPDGGESGSKAYLGYVYSHGSGGRYYFASFDLMYSIVPKAWYILRTVRESSSLDRITERDIGVCVNLGDSSKTLQPLNDPWLSDSGYAGGR